MPFTLSHPAIVMPFYKSGSKLSMTGLVIGSMIPDFEFLLQLSDSRNIGLTWYGIFLFNLPAAILFSFLFHNIIRNNVINNLPNFYAARLHHLKTFNWNSYFRKNKLTVVLSAMFGIISHLAWDSFTHSDGFMVELIPLLSENLKIFYIQTPIYSALQVIFSVIGLVAIHFQIIKMPKTSIVEENQFNFYYLAAIIISVLLIVAVRLNFYSPFDSFGDIAVTISGSFLYSLVIVSIIFNNKLANNIKERIMSITTIQFKLLDENQECLMIKTNKDLNSEVALDLRKTVDECLENNCSTIYLNAKDIENVDLSGINEVINSFYNLRQTSKKMVFVYKRNSILEKWVEATGMKRFVETAIAE